MNTRATSLAVIGARRPRPSACPPPVMVLPPMAERPSHVRIETTRRDDTGVVRWGKQQFPTGAYGHLDPGPVRLRDHG